MACKPECGGFKLINIGSSLNSGGSLIAPAVRSIATSGSKLKVTNTDGSSYDLDLPKAEPANLSKVRILNATGDKVAAILATVD